MSERGKLPKFGSSVVPPEGGSYTVRLLVPLPALPPRRRANICS